MAEPNDQTNKTEESKLDLSGLSSLSLGPDWVSGKPPAAQFPKERREERPRGPRGPRTERQRPGGAGRPDRSDRRERGGHPGHPDRRERGERHDRGGPHERGMRPERMERQEPFEPVVAVDFYPEEEPFKVLGQAIRNSCRTFELFEIARLILEKPDRFVCVVRDPAQQEGDPARLHASVPDGLPFRSEEEALAHTIRHYLDEFFTIETVEVDPPSGSFQMVHKCGITGEVLAPPNYHRYQALCREHHAAKLAHLAYSRFEQRLETSREEADIQAWLDKMKTQVRYILKENPGQVFTNAEDARLFLVTQAKEKLVRPAYSARFSGKALALLNPGDPIRRSVEFLLDYQRRFPLETANHLRGRLRRMNFAVYKRGSKGVSFVCAVKRRFRKPDEVLADNLQELIDFIEAHPNFPAKDLAKAFLGINPVKKQEPPPEAQAAARDLAGEVAQRTGEPPAEAEAEAPAEAEAEAEAPAEAEASAPAEAEAEAPAEAEAEAPAEAPVPVEAEAKREPELTVKEQAAIRQLKNDLHYLVSEGYVTEFSDGRLFVPPIREEEIRRVEKQKAATAKPDPEPAPAAPEPEPAPEPAPEPEQPVEPEPAPTEPEPEPAQPAEPAPEEPEVPVKPDKQDG
jgi:hypothetical protein